MFQESPHWLLTHNRHAEAVKYFIKSAHINKVQIPDKITVLTSDVDTMVSGHLLLELAIVTYLISTTQSYIYKFIS